MTRMPPRLLIRILYTFVTRIPSAVTDGMAFVVILLLYLKFDLREIIAFASYLPVTSASGPLPPGLLYVVAECRICSRENFISRTTFTLSCLKKFKKSRTSKMNLD